EINFDHLLRVVPRATGVGHKDRLIQPKHRDRNQIADKEKRFDKRECERREEHRQKILNMPFCAYCVQICTTFLLSSTDAFSTPSSLMLALMNSTARYAPVVTAWVDAPVNQ